MEQNRDPFHKHTGIPFDTDTDHRNDKKSKYIFCCVGYNFCPVDFQNYNHSYINEAE